MKSRNTASVSTSMGPRRAPAFGDEIDMQYGWPERNAAARAKRGVWLAMLVVLGIALAATAIVQYARVTAPEALLGEQVIKEMTFEGGLTDRATGADTVNKGVSLERAAPLKGTYAAHISGGSAYLEELFPETNDLYLSFYMRLADLPANGDVRLVRLSKGRTTVGNVLLKDGRLQLRMNSTPVGPPSDPLVVGQVYRVGIHQRAGAGSTGLLEAFLASGDAAFATPFAATTSGAWTEGADLVRIGTTTRVGMNVVIDDARLDAGAMPGPSR